ncbi:MAG TPA: response regulator [Mycobacteriales bacterium]|nr:response regulator [Mycobacteriales bacterium]
MADDGTIGSLLESNLGSHGHEASWARTGRSALREAARTTLDLVLLDLGRPDVDGVEVCRQLRAPPSWRPRARTGIMGQPRRTGRA